MMSLTLEYSAPTAKRAMLAKPSMNPAPRLGSMYRKREMPKRSDTMAVANGSSRPLTRVRTTAVGSCSKKFLCIR